MSKLNLKIDISNTTLTMNHLMFYEFNNVTVALKCNVFNTNHILTHNFRELIITTN